MQRNKRRLLSILAAMLWGCAPLVYGAPEVYEQANSEIRQLIEAVAQSQCTFIRNGREHAASQAAEHLELKWRRGKKYAKTAEDFIDNLASKSSWTGRLYQIQCPGEPVQNSGPWLHSSLNAIREREGN